MDMGSKQNDHQPMKGEAASSSRNVRSHPITQRYVTEELNPETLTQPHNFTSQKK